MLKMFATLFRPKDSEYLKKVGGKHILQMININGHSRTHLYPVITPMLFFLFRYDHLLYLQQIPKYVISLKYAAVYLAYFNSALNPIIYAGLNENFRKGFKEAFKCQLWGKRNQVRPG